MASKGQKVVYSYNTTHGLISVKDPTGHTQVRTDYDASGRKIDSVDAFGNKITYSYNLDTNSEAVTDRTGQPIQYQYDNRGNILQQTDALGNVTKYTYDQFDNRTSEFLPGNQSPTTFIYGDPNNPRLVTQEIVPNPNGSTHNLTTTYTYDAQGHVLTLIDPRSIRITNTYDPHGNLSTAQVGSLPPSTYNYDANGNVVKQTDPQGIETDSVYDASGNMTSQTMAVGTSAALKTDYTYDANGNRTTQTVHNSTGDQTTLYDYDTKNRLVETIYPDGTNSQTTLDSLGNVVGTQDQDGRVTSTFYNARSEAATIQYNFDGTSQVTGYDADGRPATVTDRGGRTTITTYNAAGFGTGDIYQDGSRVIIQPDAQGRAATITDENNKVTVTEYDDAGRQIAVIQGFGTSNALETDYTYDEDGNVKTKIVGGRLQSTDTYDDQNRLTRVDYPDGTFETSEYDNDGRNTALVDQANKRTEYSFDGQARLTEVRQVTSGGTFKTDYSIDAVGNEISQVDANSHQTSYTLNNMNRRTVRQLPDGRTETYSNYDGVGNLLQKKDFAGNQFTYGYDGSNHLTSVGGPGVSEGYTFDNAQYRVVMNDASGSTTFHHDERNFLTGQVSPPGWGTLNFTNYGNGEVNTVSSSNANGNNLTYQLDALNRPATILDGVKITLMGYDGVGNLADVVQPDGVTLVYGYDTLNHLKAVTVVGTSGTLGSYTYTLGLAGNRVNVQEASGRAVSLIPDDLYRLTGEIITSPNNADPTGTVGYVLDNVGNRQQRTSSVSPIGMQNFTGAYDTADELKPTFGFDQNGNQTSDANGFTYTYNALNQLTRVQGSGVDVSYLYDGDGLRVQKTNNLTGVVTNYLWDRNNLTGIPQVSEELQNGQVVRRYVYGPKGPLYQVQLVGNTFVTNYFAADATGSIRLVLDDSGTITDTVDYDGFGNVLRRTGTTGLGPGYQGEYTEPETGLVYLRARWYNPAEGRFMEMDGYEGDTHDPLTLHKYVGFADDPQDKTDPSGNEFESSFGGGFDTNIELTAPREGELLKGDLLAGGRWPVDLLFTSGAAQDWIKDWEGSVVRNGIFMLYNDYGGQKNTPLANKRGNATNGWGHLVHYGHIVPSDSKESYAHWTYDEAEMWFIHDIRAAETYLRHDIHVPLKQQEFDALIDVVFSRGIGTLELSELPYLINLGEYDKAQYYFIDSWPLGTNARRKADSIAYATGVYLRRGQ